MSGRTRSAVAVLLRLTIPALILICAASSSRAQQRREREPSQVYAERRAKLLAQVDGPIILFGFTGREEEAQTYLFSQEENFYYLTGYNDEGAGLVLLPESKNQGGESGWDGPREILFIPPRNPARERWVGPRPGPDDPNIHEKTGFATVKPFSQMRTSIEKLAKAYTNLYTIFPYQKENGGFPHEKEWNQYLQDIAPQAKLNDVRAKIGVLRQIKSPGEIAFLAKAIQASDDAHLAAMKMMRPGLFEYQVAAKMVYTHLEEGCESEAYAPIVGAGWNSTVLHYDQLGRKIEDGDIVVLDVGAQYSGYTGDITRTLPANGKFTPRQREIYEIVLGAENAALAALKPGMNLGRRGPHSLFQIAYNYIDSHGKDKQGRSLGRYFIHGLGHHIGLNVHDVGNPDRPLEPGMVITIEPGIYIPEESLGVRIEDNFLITDTGYKFLSDSLPRDAAAIEKMMSESKKQASAGDK